MYVVFFILLGKCWNYYDLKTSVKYSFDNSRWMQTLYEQHPDTRIRKIVAPGTHDSGSYSISQFRLFSELGRT